MQEKSHLRTKFKELRKSVDLSVVNAEICENIRNFPPYRQANNVMLFYPTKFEINLLSLLEDNKNFYFPRVNGVDLQVCPYSRDVEFKKSSYNINEPCSNPVSAEVLDLVIVPALAVDKNNYRLGYGGGFYDRFLKTTNALTIVPVYKDFLVEKLPHDEFDVPVDFVITNGYRQI